MCAAMGVITNDDDDDYRGHRQTVLPVQ